MSLANSTVTLSTTSVDSRGAPAEVVADYNPYLLTRSESVSPRTECIPKAIVEDLNVESHDVQEDGEFSGVTPEPIVGREQLREVPPKAFNDFGQGKMRHLVGNMTCRYGATRDVVNAKFYNQIAVWGGIPEAGNFCIALCEAVFVRNGDGWLIKRNDAVLMEA